MTDTHFLQLIAGVCLSIVAGTMQIFNHVEATDELPRLRDLIRFRSRGRRSLPVGLQCLAVTLIALGTIPPWFS